jgi:hypothetical protein
MQKKDEDFFFMAKMKFQENVMSQNKSKTNIVELSCDDLSVVNGGRVGFGSSPNGYASWYASGDYVSGYAYSNGGYSSSSSSSSSSS